MLIKCTNVSFSYEKKIALKNVNFAVERGDYISIIGENGAGKSTLTKGLLNLKKQSKGQIEMGGGLSNNDIGYLPQQSDIQRDFPANVYEIVISGCLNKMGIKPFYTKKEKNIANINMEKLGIKNISKKCYNELSGGQQQRVLLARALCATNKLLILDEPTSGLDQIVTKELYNIIDNINKELNIAIIMVSHDIKNVIKYSKKILHLQKEQIFFGTPYEYKNSGLIERWGYNV